ncbi:MAG: hypothetical protein ACO3E4_05620 [Candidatus Nanopelagicaceae bacterium]
MGISSYPQKIPQKTVETLTSGSSWTVPAGVTQVVVTTIGGGGGGYNALSSTSVGPGGAYGEIRISTVATTPGTSISYAIGAGGTGRSTIGGITPATSGGNTTFTGATTANGGVANTTAGSEGLLAANGALPSVSTSLGNNGGQGMITVEYWL